MALIGVASVAPVRFDAETPVTLFKEPEVPFRTAPALLITLPAAATPVLAATPTPATAPPTRPPAGARPAGAGIPADITPPPINPSSPSTVAAGARSTA